MRECITAAATTADNHCMHVRSLFPGELYKNVVSRSNAGVTSALARPTKSSAQTLSIIIHALVVEKIWGRRLLGALNKGSGRAPLLGG